VPNIGLRLTIVEECNPNEREDHFNTRKCKCLQMESLEIPARQYTLLVKFSREHTDVQI
jgi:hypothetical protein